MNVANLKLLEKSAVDPKYCLPFVDLFTSKVCTYPMKCRRFIAKKMRDFYQVVAEKRKKRNETVNRLGIYTK